ncbi:MULTISPECIES: hypothetical protein [unclassified Enterococcus]|uniref:hypothetical protein n=1 Tax=unclassified Enterococcus TaxID=2608891 RepID=UPI00201B38F6|nr:MULTISPECIES: hypothetical protein [unclassified Enterococcus]
MFSEIIIPAIQKLQLAIDDIQSEISSYQYADSIVSEYGTLDMDSLKKQLKLRKQQLKEIEKQLKNNQDFFKQAQAFVTGNLGNLLAQNSALYQLQDAVQMRINDTQERIDKLEWFVADVSKYFSDSLQVLQLAIKGATELNKVTVDSDGNYYTNDADMSWLTQMKNTQIDTQIHGNKPSTDQTLEDAVAHLGLTPDALAYWKKEMKSELKNIPKDQWQKIIKQASEGLQFDSEGNIIQIGPFQQGVIVLKNGVYDEKLTITANKELDAENWEAIKDNFGQLLAGGASIIAGGFLDLVGFATITGGSAFSLSGVGAPIGAPAVAAGISLEGIGTGFLIGGMAIAGNALSKSNVDPGSADYSFSSNSEYREQTVKDTNKKIDDLTKELNNSSKTPNSKIKQFDNSGGMDQINKDFDSLNLSNVKEIKTQYGAGRTGDLPDGSTVGTRPGSSGKSDNAPTLQITRPDGKQIKIRYPE